MICDKCGKKGARHRLTTQVYGRGRTSYLVEDVPVVICRSCGGSYVSAKTQKELDRIQQHWRKLVGLRAVPVVKYRGGI